MSSPGLERVNLHNSELVAARLLTVGADSEFGKGPDVLSARGTLIRPPSSSREYIQHCGTREEQHAGTPRFRFGEGGRGIRRALLLAGIGRERTKLKTNPTTVKCAERAVPNCNAPPCDNSCFLNLCRH